MSKETIEFIKNLVEKNKDDQELISHAHLITQSLMEQEQIINERLDPLQKENEELKSQNKTLTTKLGETQQKFYDTFMNGLNPQELQPKEDEEQKPLTLTELEKKLEREK